MIGTGAINWRNPVKPGGLNDGLVSWWLARGPWVGGGTWFDLCGRNNGTLTNGPTWTGSTHPGGQYALANDGSDDYVDIPTWDTANFAGKATQVFWINPTLAANCNLVWDGTGFYRRFCSTLLSTGIIRMWWGDINRGDSTTALTANTWQHVAIVRSGSTGAWSLSFYINGALSNTVSSIAADPTSGTTAVLSFGKSYNYAIIKGNIDDVRLYARSLTDGDVRALYQDSLSGYPQTLNRLERRIGYVAAAATFNPAWARNATTLVGAGVYA